MALRRDLSHRTTQAGKAAARRIAARLNLLLARRGVELVRLGRTPSWSHFVGLVRQHHLTPRTVFDVGVAKGSPFLYDAFPNATYFLVDPARESLPFMDRIAERLRATILAVALSDESGTATLRLKANGDIGASTLVEEDSFPLGSTYEVPCERLDDLVSDFARPSLCKIDVQGHELAALKGMTGLLDRLDIIVVETSVMPESAEVPECVDVASWLDEHGFALFDIIEVHRKPRNNFLGQMDLAFVPKDSVLRRDRRWD